MNALRQSDKIFVAGGQGLVGSAIVRTLQRKGYQNIVTAPRSKLDLADGGAVRKYLELERPDVLFLAAARVGGIQANNLYRADFIFENLQIQNNVIWSAHTVGVRRLIFLGSSCIYPKNAKQPISEDQILTGVLEYTNRPYALAKIAGLELVNAIRQQFGRDYFSVMPTNLFGEGDNFDAESSHVVPALIRKFCTAKKYRAPQVELWGTGEPLRELMHVDDCADAIVYLTELEDVINIAHGFCLPKDWSHINIGSGHEIAITGLAELIRDIVGYDGSIVFDSSKPDGTFRKRLDVRILEKLDWKGKISLRTGLERAVRYFLETQEF